MSPNNSKVQESTSIVEESQGNHSIGLKLVSVSILNLNDWSSRSRVNFGTKISVFYNGFNGEKCYFSTQISKWHLGPKEVVS